MDDRDKVDLLCCLQLMNSSVFSPVPLPDLFDSDSDTDDLIVHTVQVDSILRRRSEQRRALRNRGYVDLVSMAIYPNAHFKSHFRMPRETYCELENRIGHLINRQTRSGRPTVPVRTQILATLWLLGSPDSYRSVGEQFDIAKSSLHHSVRRVIQALNAIASDTIVWPKGERLISTKEKFLRRWGMPDVIGAVDGSYIPIKAPETNAVAYRTRKCNYAVVLQGVCDAYMNFIDCFAGYSGSVGDARNSDLYRDVSQNVASHFPNGEYIIGDKAYPGLPWCIPPYKNDRRIPLTQYHHDFNHILSTSCQVIERAFALLKGRFRRLKYLDMKYESEIPLTILVCCVLHNLCLRGFREGTDGLEEYINDGQGEDDGNNEDDNGRRVDAVFRRQLQLDGDVKRDALRMRLTGH